jgi:hypothetical protein
MGVNHTQVEAEVASGRNSAWRYLDRLNAALDNEQSIEAFARLAQTVEMRAGFTKSGFKSATLSLMPLPERKRRVLDDLRRMRARDDLKPSRRKAIFQRKDESHVPELLVVSVGLSIGGDMNQLGSLLRRLVSLFELLTEGIAIS